METNNTNTKDQNISQELLDFLVDVCEKNPNDQMLGYKLRVFIKNMRDGVKLDLDQIKFVN
jgi:hypothetical protein